MTRGRARKIFRKHYGAANKLACELGVSRICVSRWLRGEMSSQRIGAAVLARAAELESAKAEKAA